MDAGSRQENVSKQSNRASKYQGPRSTKFGANSTAIRGYIFSAPLPAKKIRPEAARLVLGVPKVSGRLYNLGEWWIGQRLLSSESLDTGVTAF